LMGPWTPSRAALLRLLSSRAVERRLPITLGDGAPQAVVQRDPGGRWTLRPLVLDEARAAAARTDGDWMPEHEWRFLAPGAPLISAPTRESFATAVEKSDWPWGGSDD